MKNLLLFCLLTFVVGGCSQTKEKEESQKPNVLIILMDDMGYSDLGFMGSEIETPNIDKLAANGIFFNQFYNTGRCCPTRASLMTGLYAHQTGMGWMTASDLGTPGYTGDLNQNCITIAQALKQNGYMCYMTGKWHLTHNSYQNPDGPKHNWPIQRGFDKFYGHLTGGGGYFQTNTMLDNNEWIEALPEDFYLTSAISENTLEILDQHFKDGKNNKPFFHYLAYYAPHRPLHALQEDIIKYEGKFMMGWDELRERKYKRLQELGIVDPAECKLSDRDSEVMAWDSLSEKEKELWAARMAVYAAQIDRADQGIGQVLKKLEEYGALENTLIFFLSDNGGSAEKAGGNLKYEQISLLGTGKQNQSCRREWSNACNAPFRYFKAQVHEGGISTPLIVHWPEGIQQKGGIVKQLGHVIDLFPTILEVAGADYPDSFGEHKINPLQGKSLAPSFEGETVPRGPLFFEHQACRAIREDRYKLVSLGIEEEPFTLEWELYDMSVDRSETNNIAADHPQIVQGMIGKYDDWAEENQVYPIDNRPWKVKVSADVRKDIRK